MSEIGAAGQESSEKGPENLNVMKRYVHQKQLVFHAGRSGFSLVELLVTIAILVVISSISLGVMAGVNRSAEMTKDKRNAQTVAALYASARAAGASFSSAPGDLQGRINELVTGLYGSGNLAASKFQLSPLGTHEMNALLSRLELDGQWDILKVKPDM